MSLLPFGSPPTPNATASTLGKIQLAGVLTGTATTPALSNTAVTPGSYTNTNLTVGADGRITVASNGSGGSGSITNYVNVQQIDQTPAGGSYGLLSGTVNSINGLFTVSHGSYVTGSLLVLVNGPGQTQGVTYDWTETSPGSGTFTFNAGSIPISGSTVQAIYITQVTTNGYQTLPLATITGINTKTVTATSLYTVPAGKTAILTNAIVRCTAASAITVGPTASIGVVASSYADIYASAVMTTLTTTSSAFGYSSVGIFGQAAASTVITFNLTNAATGTSQTVSVDIMGYLV